MPCGTVHSTRCYTLSLLTSVNLFNSPPFHFISSAELSRTQPSRQIPTTTSAGISPSPQQLRTSSASSNTSSYLPCEARSTCRPHCYVAIAARHVVAATSNQALRQHCPAQVAGMLPQPLLGLSESMWLAKKRSIQINTLCA
jgi:hypothetical protein